MRLEVSTLYPQPPQCRIFVSLDEGEDMGDRILVNGETAPATTRTTAVCIDDVIEVDGRSYRIGTEEGQPEKARFIDEDGHMAMGVTSCGPIAEARIELDRNMRFDETTPPSQIIAFLDEPGCDHPGCLHLYGSDNLEDEIKGTAYEGKVSEYVDYTIKEAMQEPRIAVKMALIGLAIAGVRGTGARQAFRRLQCAYIHALPFSASVKHEVIPQ